MSGEQHLAQTVDSLRALINAADLPPSVREALRPQFEEIETLIQKLEQGEIHIAAFGRVSVGKSSLLNALLGTRRFEVGVLHGTTTSAQSARWQEAREQGIHLIDTPGINEVDGATRERMALDVAGRCDLVLFVVDGDLTASELSALRELHQAQRPLVLVLNKADRYSAEDRAALLASLREKTSGWVRAEDVLSVASDPRAYRVIERDAAGREHSRWEQPPADIEALRERIDSIVAAEGKTLAALNAGLYAGRISDQLARQLAAAQRDIAEKLIRNYALGKGVAVGLNPLPAADLLAAAGLDVALVMHLSRVYGLPLTKTEAGELIGKIVAQVAALMGAIWGVHLVASALKGLSAGVSIALTAGAQGALAYFGTLLVGRAAEAWLIHGKSWGEKGPKRVVQDIIDSLDRDSILREARAEIMARLRSEA